MSPVVNKQTLEITHQISYNPVFQLLFVNGINDHMIMSII